MNRNQVASIPASLSRSPRLKVLRLEENCLALEAITPQLLKESQISLLAVDGNLFDAKQMREADGYDQVFHRYRENINQLHRPAIHAKCFRDICNHCMPTMHVLYLTDGLFALDFYHMVS